MAALFSCHGASQRRDISSLFEEHAWSPQFFAAKTVRMFSTQSTIKPMVHCRATKEEAAEIVKPWSFEKEVLEEVNREHSMDKPGDEAGLGITQFLRNKRILLTGATGFLGKVLLEKILRTQPDLGKIYLLINADTTAQAEERLAKDVQESTLFQKLRMKHGSYFKHFLSEKLVAIPGKINKTNLGLDARTRKELSENVDIIINSAASTNFTERFDVALDINTKGPLNLLNFAKECPYIKLFTHISTAFVNGTRKGLTMESPFVQGRSIAHEMLGRDSAPELDVWKEIEIAKNKRQHKANEMKQLGMERAKLHGWQDTYVFTKAMGEMLINEARGNLPVIILRPSVVESTISQPFGGWIQGTRMMDPILLSFGRGHIDTFYADPNGVLDVVPADMVVNVLLAAMTYHAGQGVGFNVYQVGSSSVNPLTFQTLAACTTDHFMTNPCRDSNGDVIVNQPELLRTKLSLELHIFLNYRLPVLLAKVWGSPELRKQAKFTALIGERIDELLSTYSPYTFYDARFDITNTKNLYEKMSRKEKEDFRFDIWSIDWSDYITNVHLPGLRKYSVREGNSTFRPINIKQYIQGVLAPNTS